MIALTAAACLVPMIGQAGLFGLALAAARTRFGAPLGRWSTISALVVAFATLDALWTAVAAPLNLSCSIGNATIASATGLTEPFWLNETPPLGWFEIATWSGQTFIAAMTASWMAPAQEPPVEWS